MCSNNTNKREGVMFNLINYASCGIHFSFYIKFKNRNTTFKIKIF